MKIGIFQSHIAWEDKEKNLKKLKKFLSTNKKDVDLLLLPEMSFTGFSMNTKATGEVNNESVDAIARICKEYRIAIGFGWVKNKTQSENHYTIVDENGKVMSDYVKIHPFSYSDEDKYFASGESLSFFEMNEIIFSTMICYDLRFPELFRIASKKSNVVIVPANWPEKRNEHWETLLRARAIENQVYIIGINCVGNIGNIEYCGSSCVISPDGEVLAEAYGTEAVMFFDLQNDVDEFRNRFPTYKDRKDKLYYNLMGENV